MVGVNEVRKPSDPWPEKARLVKPLIEVSLFGGRWFATRRWSSDGSKACSVDNLLQKLTSGTWPLGSGEQPVGTEV